MEQLINLDDIELIGKQSEPNSEFSELKMYDDLIYHKFHAVSEIVLNENGTSTVKYKKNKSVVVFSRRVTAEALFFSVFLHEDYQGTQSIYPTFRKLISLSPQQIVIASSTKQAIVLTITCKDGSNERIILKKTVQSVAQIAPIEEYFSVPLAGNNYFASRCLYPLPLSTWKQRIEQVANNPNKLYSPLTVVIEVARGCNYGCEFCYAADLMNNEFMPNEALLQLIENLPLHKTKIVRFVGFGEQMLHPYFREALLLAKAYGMGTFVITNGSKLTQSPVFFTHMLDFLRISFNAGTPETYQAINKVSMKSFDNVLDGVNKVLREKDTQHMETPAIGMTMVLTETNKHEIAEFVEVANQAGIDFVFLKYPDIETLTQNESLYLQDQLNLVSRKYASKNFHIIDTIFSYNRAERINYTTHKMLGCVMHQLRCVVKANGDVLSNEQLGGTHYAKWGNILREPWEQIINGKARELSQIKRQKTSMVCQNCIFKDLHKFARTLIENM